MAKTWCPECGERQFLAADKVTPTCAHGHAGLVGIHLQGAIELGFDVKKRLRRVITVPRAQVHKRPTIARRSEEEREWSDATCTPKWLADLLLELRGEPFDIDPCSNPRSWIHSRWSYSLGKGLDGLRLEWVGSAFKNNPFSSPMAWQQKARHELSIGRCTELVELCKLDPSTEWWDELTEPVICSGEFWNHRGICYTPDLWLFKKRVQYDEHPLLIEKRKCEVAEGKRNGAKSGKSSNNFASALLHHRFDKPPLKLDQHATLWVRP